MSLWSETLYQQTVVIVLSFLFFSGFVLYFLRKKSMYWVASWASVKSWLFVAPILFALVGLAAPWPLIVMTMAAIFGSKIFFQMMGMYHRSNFVWVTYIFLFLLAACIFYDRRDIYNAMPMYFLGAICMIPVLRNATKHMIQYIALTSMAFSFLGWAFMHLGWIWNLERGPYMVLYIVILTEFCDNMYLSLSRVFGQVKLFSKITPRRNLESFVIAFLSTLVLAWAMRQLLPVRSEEFWIASAICASLGGSLGDLVLSVIRRDLGIKDVSGFIIGRGDYLSAMDRLIFVAPIFFYVMQYLQKGVLG